MAELLDTKDRRILEQLDLDCRQNNALIGRKVKLSKDAVGYRIKRMETLHVILGYYAVFNVVKLGHITYKFMLTFQNTTSEIEKEIVEYLGESQIVGWLVSCDGPYNLMAVTWVRNAMIFDRFFTDFLKKYSEYIKKREVIVITENHACRKAYLFNKAEDDTRDIYYSGEPVRQIDELELKIIKALSNNARTKLRDLGSLLSLSAEDIAYRLKKLVKMDVAQAFRPIINTPLLGYQYYNVLFRLRFFDNMNVMFDFFKRQPNIIYFVRYLGSYDVGIDVEVRNAEELRDIIKRIKDLFSKDIESYDTVLVYQEHKLSYMP